MDKYLIANSTREQRAKFVADALGINALGAEPLTKENRVLIQKYIDGEIELDVLRKIAIDKYKK
ncbi:antitoxin VbhA family protein [Bacillus circulans]|uniref:antitoxin VbhA family protein n=1 Tax=Niallia circulans TaxID=1397 RepID=UPI001560C5C6|nr:antitoxin VbhA family protein [Niallia circulans]NRG29533.1 antitoxin VbhA family protein [Niallia circulans]